MRRRHYANRVNIIKKVKVGQQWQFAPVLLDAHGRVRWDYVRIGGSEEVHKEGTYYIDWYEDGRRRRESVGTIPSEILQRARRKGLVVESEKAGIEVNDGEAVDSRTIDAAIRKYLDSVKLLRKQSTHLVYKNALEQFQARCSRQFVHQVTRDDLLDFMGQLQHIGLGNRSICTKAIVVVQWLKTCGISGLLRKGDWPSFTTEERPIYTPEELQQLFLACEPTERVLFQFFLLSGFRESEVRYLTWSDVDFREHVARVTAKQSWGFTPKNWEEREVPIPCGLVDALRELKRHALATTDLVFPSSAGQPDQHFLEKLKQVAYRGKLNCGRCQMKPGGCATGPFCERIFLHKFRHTFATMHLRDGIDLRTVQHWMGHNDLKSTMVYLKPARGRDVLEKINGGSLAAAAVTGLGKG